MKYAATATMQTYPTWDSITLLDGQHRLTQAANQAGKSMLSTRDEDRQRPQRSILDELLEQTPPTWRAA